MFNWLNFANWAELHKGHVQESRARGIQVAQNDLHLQIDEVITVQSLWVKRKCQLVVRLKANKCYQELLCFLSSYMNLVKLLNFQGLRGRLLTTGRFQTSSPWSKLLTNYKTLAMLVLVFMFGQLFLGKVCCNPTAFRWVAPFVAI